MQTIRVRKKGQITVPVAMREALDLQEGDLLVVERIDNRVVLERAKDVVDWTSGALAEYACGVADPAAERAQFEQDVANEVFESLRNE